MLELKNISKHYEIGSSRLEVLSDFNETWGEGELIALVGPSGAGKSTLLHIAGGLDAPSSGQVIFEGKDIYGLKERELNMYRGNFVGFVFQSHYLLDDFTALENVMLPKLILGGDKRVTKSAAHRLLESVGLEDRVAHYPSELSGGEQQRVSIARALVNSPKILLADEPTGNLDKANSLGIMDILSSLSNRGVCVVIVTHDEMLASKCHRQIRLDKI